MTEELHKIKLIFMLERKSITCHSKAISIVSVFYGINILLGLGRDTVLASAFGATEQLDALLLGINFVRTLGINIAFAISSTTIPIFAIIISQNDHQFLSNSASRWLCASVIVLIPFSLLLAFGAEPLCKLIGPGLSEHGIIELKAVLIILSPLLAILGCSGLFKALSDSFGFYHSYPIFLGLMTLGLISGVVIDFPQAEIYRPSLGMLIGGMIGLALQPMLIQKRLPFSELWNSIKKWRHYLSSYRHPRFPLRSAFLMIGSSMILLAQGVIERAYASQLPAGSVVALSLSLNILAVPSTLFFPAISAVVLPHLSRKEQKDSNNKFGFSLKYYLVLIIFSAVVTLLLIFGSDFIVSILFLRGRFSKESALLTATTLKLMSFGFIAYALTTVLRQILIARCIVIFDTYINLIILIIKLLLLYFLVPKYGLFGIVFSIVISTFITTGLYFVLIYYSNFQRKAIVQY
jgi:putative peptidoglycan lipid II flippase